MKVTYILLLFFVCFTNFCSSSPLPNEDYGQRELTSEIGNYNPSGASETESTYIIKDYDQTNMKMSDSPYNQGDTMDKITTAIISDNNTDTSHDNKNNYMKLIAEVVSNFLSNGGGKELKEKIQNGLHSGLEGVAEPVTKIVTKLVHDIIDGLQGVKQPIKDIGKETVDEVIKNLLSLKQPIKAAGNNIVSDVTNHLVGLHQPLNKAVVTLFKGLEVKLESIIGPIKQMGSLLHQDFLSKDDEN